MNLSRNDYIYWSSRTQLSEARARILARMNRVLVIGATGNIGGQVVSQLAAKGASVRAMARNPQVAHFPPHVEVVRGDLTDPESLDRCLANIDSVFLVWVAPPTTVDAALERITKYARRIVFLSAPLKTAHPLFQQPNGARTLAERIERLIENSGRAWTFLRPGMLAGNAARWWPPQICAGDVVRWPYLSVPTAPIDERDVAAVAVRVLCEDGHTGSEYVLTGPQSLTHAEQVMIIGDVIGRTLHVEEISPEDAPRELASVIPGPGIRMLLDAWAAAAGQPAFMTSTVEEITGTPAREFREWVKTHAAEFQRPQAASIS